MTAEAAPRAANILRDSSMLAEALIAGGIDSPLKLDLVTELENAGGAFVSIDQLALFCGASKRDAGAALDTLERAGLVECRRFYNLAEFAASKAPAARSRLAPLAGLDSLEIRRLRRAVLVRAHGA